VLLDGLEQRKQSLLLIAHIHRLIVVEVVEAIVVVEVGQARGVGPPASP
jgi:hypothetical protein